MICEQFVYGLFSNTGYVTVKTPNVLSLLSKQSFQQLKSLTLANGENSKKFQMHFKTEDVITVTLLQKSVDKYGRAGTINHTFIMKTSDYLSQFPPAQLVDNHFIKDLTNPPDLYPLTVSV